MTAPRTVLFLDSSRSLITGMVCRDGAFTPFTWETRMDFACRITDMVTEMLAQAQLTLPQIDLLAVCSGPGSLTGIRVGMAYFRALAQTLRKPLLAVDLFTWSARTAAASGRTGPISLVMPAFMNHVFLAELPDVTAPEILPHPAFVPAAVLQERTDLTGIRCPELTTTSIEPSPAALFQILQQAPQAAYSFDTLLHATPLYVVPSQPELKLDEKRRAP
jgi:tRNA threonylcarbamoyl adenosine modification protein YeaZ